MLMWDTAVLRDLSSASVGIAIAGSKKKSYQSQLFCRIAQYQSSRLATRLPYIDKHVLQHV